MSARDGIFAAIQANRPAGEHDLPAVPRFAVPEADSERLQAFKTNLAAMGGRLMEAGPAGDPLAPLRARLATAAVVCSAVPEIDGGRDLATVAKPHDLADIDVAVVRSVFGVAETGSVWVTEGELHVNALAIWRSTSSSCSIQTTSWPAYRTPIVGRNSTRRAMVRSIRARPLPPTSKAC